MKLTSTIEQFCHEHNLSRSTLYELWRTGKGPRTMRVGRHVLISAEAGADWRKSMEAETAAESRAHPAKTQAVL